MSGVPARSTRCRAWNGGVNGRGLAGDIERYLTHEPVTACPPTTAYRIQKFVRRNKVMVMAGGAVAAALVLGVVASTWQAVRATRAEREQSRLREKAEQAQANETKQRLAAVDVRTPAEEQRRLTQASELRARQNAYAADMNLA